MLPFSNAIHFMPSSVPKNTFTQQLLHWHSQNPRPLPWKDTTDPYLIWLSEIILQQTRVEQGTPYFERFRETFPTVFDLAKADEDAVLKLWEGLGYYSRARNLHFTAQHIAEEFQGEFPDTYEELLKLKGVGPYTAAAIASFAFGRPTAVVDGNVYRVLARYFGLDLPIDTTAGKKAFFQLANELIDPADPGTYNQAIMNFGALQCTPGQPDCQQCTLQSSCAALAKGTIKSLPVKSKSIAKKNRYFHFLIFNAKGTTWLEKRQGKDIWKGLYQFPMVEVSSDQQDNYTLESLTTSLQLPDATDLELKGRSRPFRQTLSHQHIHAYFWEITAPTLPEIPEKELISVPLSKLSDFAFPRIIDWYLGDKILYLDLR
jgi:A/G-specific adenine glycosylase